MIKAYAIFDGGGVLGAALAGCLKAAEVKGIRFVGFGGTSAGSIIATLGAVGMTAEQIERAIVETPFVDFLQDGGRPVARFKKVAGKTLSCLNNLKWYTPWHAPLAVWHSWNAYGRVGLPLGVDDGQILQRKLHDLIAAHRPDWNRHRCADVTFEMLDRTPGCYPLKVVASDVTKRRPVEFSLQRTDYGNSVLNAVRASTCYPCVFRPYVVQRRRLVDGGLSSNLPASLFYWEQRRTGLPAFAFDLVGTDEDPPAKYTFQDYVKDMAATAIDAGDEFLRDTLEGVYHVPVPIPREYDVLDFEISRKRREELFDIGFRHATQFLEKQAVLKLLMQTGEGVQRSLQVQFGEPALYEPVLAAVAADVERVSAARNLRATIMLPTGRETRIVVYSHGMIRRRDDGRLSIDTDIDLEISVKAGASGRAWETGEPQVADLTRSRRKPAEWGMTEAQYAKVPPDRMAMLSFPIPRLVIAANATDDDPRSRYLGSLTLDTSTPLTDTKWLEDGSDTVPNRRVTEKIGLWLNVIQRLLLFDQ